jgi:hypothetical protein
MLKNIVIVHFNTPLLTECLIHSINHFTPNTNIYIFDNSDKEPFLAKFDNVKIIDNTKGQIVNFDNWLKKFSNRVTNSHNNYASAKHCYSIQKCIDIIQDNFVLLDSDILLKCDISGFFKNDKIYVGKTARNGSFVERVVPFICFINVKMCNDNNISYFNGDYMHQLSIKNNSFDTGAYFFFKTKNIPHENVDIDKYIVHFKAASWKESAKKTQISEFKWLLDHEKLWFFGNIELKNKILAKSNNTVPKISSHSGAIKKSTRRNHLQIRKEKILQRRLRR